MADGTAEEVFRASSLHWDLDSRSDARLVRLLGCGRFANFRLRTGDEVLSRDRNGEEDL